MSGYATKQNEGGMRENTVGKSDSHEGKSRGGKEGKLRGNRGEKEGKYEGKYGKDGKKA